MIPRGVDEDDKVTGIMRKKICQLLHVGHLGEVKSERAAEKGYYWPSMANQVKQEVKDCEVCQANAKSQADEPPPELNEFASRPMEKVSSDIFHHGDDNWLVLCDWYMDSALQNV